MRNRKVAWLGTIFVATTTSLMSASWARASDASAKMTMAVNTTLADAAADIQKGDAAYADKGVSAALKTLKNYVHVLGDVAYADKASDSTWKPPKLSPVPAQLTVAWWNQIVVKQDQVEDKLVAEEMALLNSMETLNDQQFISRVKSIYDVGKQVFDLSGGAGPWEALSAFWDISSSLKEFHDNEQKYLSTKKGYKVSLKKKAAILTALRELILQVRSRRRTVKGFRTRIKQIQTMLPLMQTTMNAVVSMPIPPKKS